VLGLSYLSPTSSVRYCLWAGYSLPASINAAAVVHPDQRHPDPDEPPKEKRHRLHSKHPLAQQNNLRRFSSPSYDSPSIARHPKIYSQPPATIP